ncbi:MAG: hypothetical protein JO125_09780 [Chloroflexi bacterium]|nr:hypothetical protein [Ktedonobacteraceae bacterium]MBV9707683.1 hypothetical protein [Chloroflexota bacterium]
MNYIHGTPLHRKHFNTRCNGADCQAFELVETVNAETGERIIYFWPLYQRVVTTKLHFCTTFPEM